MNFEEVDSVGDCKIRQFEWSISSVNDNFSINFG
jgi:hypothetical protein